MLFESPMPKIKKIYFYIFISYNFSSNSNFPWNLVWCFEMLLKSLMRKWKKSTMEILIYANFSYKYTPKPVGRIDPSRLERVKRWIHYTSLVHAQMF